MEKIKALLVKGGWQAQPAGRIASPFVPSVNSIIYLSLK
jgi:hypothetical protein